MPDWERLARLRRLVEHLEGLPESVERDRTLHETRKRLVDVETDARPSAFAPPGAERREDAQRGSRGVPA